MKRFLLLLTILICDSCFAQHSYGVELGMTFPWAERTGFDYYKATTGKTFSAVYMYQKDWLCIKGSAGVLQKGFMHNVVFVDTSGNVLGQGDYERHRFNYGEASVKAGFTKGEKYQFQALLGLQYGHYFKTNVHMDEVVLDDGYIYPGYNQYFSNLKRPDLAANMEVRLGATFKEINHFFIVTEYGYGLMKIKYRNTPTNEPWKNHFASVRLGLMVDIGKPKSTEKSIDEEIEESE